MVKNLFEKLKGPAPIVGVIISFLSLLIQLVVLKLKILNIIGIVVAFLVIAILILIWHFYSELKKKEEDNRFTLIKITEINLPNSEGIFKYYSEVKENGDGYLGGEREIIYTGDEIRWHELIVGVTENVKKRSLKEINLKISDQNGRPMTRFVKEDNPRKKRIVIFFHPTITSSERNGFFKYSYTWKGVWKPLIKAGEDTAPIKIHRDIRYIEWKIKFPLNFKVGTKLVFRNREVKRGIQIPNEGNNNTFLWEKSHPLPGTYTLDIWFEP